MFTGMVIDELMKMVERVESHAHEPRMMAEQEHEQEVLVAHYAYRAAESQPMMAGVA